jgi:hypothetical protein
VEKWGKYWKEGEVRLHVQPDGDHGFYIVLKEDEEKLLRDGLAWVQAKWLARFVKSLCYRSVRYLRLL